MKMRALKSSAACSNYDLVKSPPNGDQLISCEGARVRRLYELIARQNGVTWRGRNYDPADWGKGDVPNRCLSAATACLYGLTEAAILAAGYAPAIGFLHTGQRLSFVYDIADLFKFATVVPVAMQVAGRAAQGKLVGEPGGEVRRGCRDAFRRTLLLEKIIPTIENVLMAGNLPPPQSQRDDEKRG